MSLLQGIMEYPNFNMKASILPQILKLEEHFNQYEKLGGKLTPDLRSAVLLRVITGPLKIHLNMTLNEGSSYQKIREVRRGEHKMERERRVELHFNNEPNTIQCRSQWTRSHGD